MSPALAGREATTPSPQRLLLDPTPGIGAARTDEDRVCGAQRPFTVSRCRPHRGIRRGRRERPRDTSGRIEAAQASGSPVVSANPMPSQGR